MSRPFRTGGERMKSAIAFIAVLAVLLLVASCTKTPDEVFSSLRLETGIKAPLVATSVRLSQLSDSALNSLSENINFSLDLPKFELGSIYYPGEGDLNIGLSSQSPSSPIEISDYKLEETIPVFPDTSGPFDMIDIELPILLTVDATVNTNEKAIVVVKSIDLKV